MKPASSTLPAERPMRADAVRNREKIVAAAREIVAEEGTEAQIDDVARRAGVGVGTVYRHFPNKDALMAELIGQCMLENAASAERCATMGDPWDAFATMVWEGCEAMVTDAARRRTFGAASDEAFALAAPAKARMVDAAGRLIDRAHDAGVLREDFTVGHMGFLMCGLSGSIEMDSRARQPIPGGWRKIVEVALDGLRTTP